MALTLTIESTFSSSADFTDCRDVWVAGDYAFVAASKSDTRLVVLDVSSPTSPSVAATLVLAATNSDNVGCIKVVGTLAYIGCNDRFSVVDVADPLVPAELGFLTFGGSSGNMRQHSLDVVGDYAYLLHESSSGTGDEGLRVVDISDPTAPSVVGHLTTTTLNGTTVCGALVHPGAGHVWGTGAIADRLTAFDVTTPAAPVADGSVQGADLDGAWAFCIAGDYAYGGTITQSRFWVVDVSDPSAPSFVTHKSLSSRGRATEVLAGYLFVASGTTTSNSRFSAWALTDPANPVQDSFIGSVLVAVGLHMDGQRAYICNGAAQVQVIRVDGLPTPPAGGWSVGHIRIG